MAGMTTRQQLTAPTTVVLPHVFGAAGGRSRMAGPALCPIGH
ncbi:MAG: hypothetical protein ABSG39_09260 [Acidimicrobiales bacterium]